MRTIVFTTCLLALIAAAFGTQVSVSAQAPAPGPEAFVSSAVGGNARGQVSLLAAGLQAAAAQQINTAQQISSAQQVSGAQASPAQQPAPSQQPAPGADGRPVRRLTADEAVALAIENNLGIQISRLDPQIEDLNVLSAQGAYTPAFQSLFQNNNIQRPSANIFTGSQDRVVSSKVEWR